MDHIFDGIARFTVVLHKQDAINKKYAQQQSCVSKKCGNCFHWMKTTCKPEKIGKQFKSCNDSACLDFTLDNQSKALADKFGEELINMQAELIEYKNRSHETGEKYDQR